MATTPTTCEFTVELGSSGSEAVLMGTAANTNSDGFITTSGSALVGGDTVYYGVESGHTLITTEDIAALYPVPAVGLPANAVVSVATLLDNINAAATQPVNVYASVQHPIGGENYFTLQADFTVDNLVGLPSPTPPTYPLTDLVFAPSDMLITIMTSASDVLSFSVPYVVPDVTFMSREYTVSASMIECGSVDETSNVLLAVSDTVPFEGFTSIKVPADSTIDVTGLSTKTYNAGATKWVLGYHSPDTGQTFLLSDTGGEDFGIPMWSGGSTLTLSTNDVLGFIVVAVREGVACTTPPPYAVSETLTLKSPYLGSEAYCTNTPEEGGGEPVDPEPTASRRHVLHTGSVQVQFYNSYKLIPADSDTVRPQKSEVLTDNG